MSRKNRRPDFDLTDLPAGSIVRGIKLAGELTPVKSPASKVGKYRNVRTIYNGVLYDSKFEAEYAAELDIMKASGYVTLWIRQPTFRLGCPENVYRPDFFVVHHNGYCAAVDVKGTETAKFRRDKKLWAQYGECPLEIVRRGEIVETIPPRTPKP